MHDQNTRTSKEPRSTAAPLGQPLKIGVRLQPVGQSDQPVFSNITAVQAVAGMVFLDFGFVEPNAFEALARRSQAGKRMPDAVNGRLSCRVALGRDVAETLVHQLLSSR